MSEFNEIINKFLLLVGLQAERLHSLHLVMSHRYTQEEDDALARVVLSNVITGRAGVRSVFHKIERGFFLWRGESD